MEGFEELLLVVDEWNLRQSDAPNSFELRNHRPCLSTPLGCDKGLLTIWVLDEVAQPIDSHKCKMISM